VPLNQGVRHRKAELVREVDVRDRAFDQLGPGKLKGGLKARDRPDHFSPPLLQCGRDRIGDQERVLDHENPQPVQSLSVMDRRPVGVIRTSAVSASGARLNSASPPDRI
jgi:hypothetical protein